MNEVSSLFGDELVCVNLGLKVFYEAMQDQHLKSVHVDWKPPAGGDPRLMEILAWLNS